VSTIEGVDLGAMEDTDPHPQADLSTWPLSFGLFIIAALSVPGLFFLGSFKTWARIHLLFVEVM
jgi:hypothetical protein